MCGLQLVLVTVLFGLSLVITTITSFKLWSVSLAKKKLMMENEELQRQLDHEQQSHQTDQNYDSLFEESQIRIPHVPQTKNSQEVEAQNEISNISRFQGNLFNRPQIVTNLEGDNSSNFYLYTIS